MTPELHASLKRELVASGLTPIQAHAATDRALAWMARRPVPLRPASTADGFTWLERQMIDATSSCLNRLAREYDHPEAMALLEQIRDFVAPPGVAGTPRNPHPATKENTHGT